MALCHAYPVLPDTACLCAPRAAAITTFAIYQVDADQRSYDAETSDRSSFSETDSGQDEESRSSDTPVRKWRLIACIFLPFVLGYYLSYVFRTITSAISNPLLAEFGLDAAGMGLLASVYFLAFAAAQIPIGVLLDRYGPRRVQAVLLVLAGGGATLFGTASGYLDLIFARALIGLGVAGALMAGLKAVVTWFPKERVALVNGWMIMLGSLGAVTATAPAEWLLGWTGWRGLFEVLTFATFAAAALIFFIVPEREPSSNRSAGLSLAAVYSDGRFWRIAPLSATCIGSSWAFQSLWAAPWLKDVEGLPVRRHKQDIHNGC